MKKLSKIDYSIIDDHTFIDENDNCHFAYSYTAYEDFSYSSTNQLIKNFKISPEFKGLKRWYYKEKAINEVALMLEYNFTNEDLKSVTFVPIPPSKCKTDPMFDNRMNLALHKAFNGKADVRDLVYQIKSMPSSHLAIMRPSIHQLQSNMAIDKTLVPNIKSNIVLVDDVITTGAHFIACKNLLSQEFPNSNILGVFVARREIKDYL